MSDTLTPEQRSERMSRIHGQDTEIEKTVRLMLHKRGFRFRKNVRTLTGTPDIVLPKYKAVVFIHGCWWHGHTGCSKSRLPVTRKAFWEDKRRANQSRDARKTDSLMKSGWRVGIVWQCALRNTGLLSENIEALASWIQSASNYIELPKKE